MGKWSKNRICSLIIGRRTFPFNKNYYRARGLTPGIPAAQSEAAGAAGQAGALLDLTGFKNLLGGVSKMLNVFAIKFTPLF